MWGFGFGKPTYNPIVIINTSRLCIEVIIVEWLPDVEIYLRDCTLDRAVAWAASQVGPLLGPFDCGKAITYHPAIGSVVITSSIEGGAFLSLWFNTSARPWATDLECARAAAPDLGCIVRCDPGSTFPNVSPHSDVLLEISGTDNLLIPTDAL